MGCLGYQKGFTAYLQGELDRSQREAADRHLRICPACQRNLEALRRTVELVRSLPEVSPPPPVQAQLFQKIRAVRQPMGWLERVRFQWRVAGLGVQARAWGVGLAATLLFFVAGASTLDRWSTDHAESLGIGINVTAPRGPDVYTPPSGLPGRMPAAPGGGEPASAARILTFPQTPMVVGTPSTVYFVIESSRDLPDAELRLYPPAGVAVGDGAILQDDASYLVYRGGIAAGSGHVQSVTVKLRPSQEGLSALRVVLVNSGRPVAQEQVTIHVAAPAQ